MNSDVEEIKSKLNIVDILGEYIRLDKAGANWKANCPFHNEKTPSFMVNEEKQFWHCFGCQKHGDIFTFVMEMEGLEFRDALKQLAEKAGVKLKNYNPEKAEEKNRTLEILELATKFYEIQLWKGEGKIKIINYLRGRGLKDETIKDFRLGYAPKGWRNLFEFLIKRGYKAEEIAKTGLLVEKINSQSSSLTSSSSPYKGEGGNRFYDRFRDRIIFPIADYSGRIIGFSARVAPGGDESQAKYVNTPETEVYHKSRVLYGMDKAKSAIKQNDFALLVEGNMDVIAASQAGIKNTIAVSGTALTQEQVGIIKRYGKKIKMFFDMDSAGEAATKKSVKLCFANDVSVQVVSLPKGKDAAELARENPKELKKAVEHPLDVMEYFLTRTFQKYDKNKAEGKKKITEELLDIVSSFESAVEKSHWIKKIAEKLQIAETALTDALKKINLKSRIEKNNSEVNVNSESLKNKSEILTEELIGLIFVSNIVWKKAASIAEKFAFWPKDRLLNLAIKKGEKSNFEFNSFIKEISDDRELAAHAEKIFLQKKYRPDINGNLEEILIQNPLEELEVCLKEITKEAKKEELARLSADLKIAEEKKDEEAKKFLCREFDKISKELAELLK